MEFNSKEDLYQKLLPVFAVKERLLSITTYKNININDIWSYLSINVWCHTKNLTTQKIVNDIIIFDPSKINK